MRALTVYQPYASLIVLGLKPVENRSWQPRPAHTAVLIGPHQRVAAGERIAIHAAKTAADDRVAWAALGGEPAPRGAVIGSVTIVETHRPDECRRTVGYCPRCHDSTDDHDCDVGARRYCSPHADPNACHWTFADPAALPEPVPMRGRQGLWRINHDAVKRS